MRDSEVSLFCLRQLSGFMQTLGVKPTKANLFPISHWGVSMLNLTDREDRILALYEIIHGPITNAVGCCSIEVKFDDGQEPIGMKCMKDGHECWFISKHDLLFDYETRFL